MQNTEKLIDQAFGYDIALRKKTIIRAIYDNPYTGKKEAVFEVTLVGDVTQKILATRTIENADLPLEVEVKVC